MTSRSIGATLLLLVAALPAGAESHSAEDLTPLALARAATVVAVVTPDAGALRVTERLRGPVLAGQRLAARGQLPAGRSFVGHFAPGPAGDLELLGGPLGLFSLPDGDTGEATATLFRSLAALSQPEMDDTQPLHAPLVAALSAATPRARAGAAHDLWRQPGLLAGATSSERRVVIEAFRAAQPHDAARPHLARALGVLRVPESGVLLVNALVDEGGKHLAPAVGRALRDLADDKAIRSLATHAASASPEVRVRIADALGEAGGASARSALETLLPDADKAVRRTAAVALGRLRSADPASALLLRLRETETDAGVRRALVWALAQCDDDGAWDALRAVAESDADARLRRFAADTLRNPRRSFVR